MARLLCPMDARFSTEHLTGYYPLVTNQGHLPGPIAISHQAVLRMRPDARWSIASTNYQAPEVRSTANDDFRARPPGVWQDEYPGRS
jgi:hypothetical protein